MSEPLNSPWWRRPFLWGILVCALLLAAAPWGWKLYQRAFATRLIATARESLEKKDVATAVSMLKQALERDPSRVDAAKMIRDLAVQVHDREAPSWAARVHEMEPSYDNFRVWVIAAIELGLPSQAQEALEQERQRYSGMAGFHSLDSIAHAMAGEWVPAISAMQRAVELEPTRENKVTLASLKLKSPDREIRHNAEQYLLQSAAPRPLHFQALRELLDYYAGQRDWEKAAPVAETLIDDEELDARRRLTSVEVLAQTNSSRQRAAIDRLLHRAEKQPGLIPDAFQSIARSNERQMALDWWAQLPDPLRLRPEIAAEAMQLLVTTGGIDRAKQLRGEVNWGDQTFLPLLILPGEKSADPAEAAKFWKNWATLQQTNPSLLQEAAAMALRFGNMPAYQTILWKLSESPAGQREPLLGLFAAYRKSKKAEDLYQIASVMFLRFPNDPAAANNRAILGLLCSKDVAVNQKLAEENLLKNPDFPPVYSTRALGLLLEGKPQEGLALLEKLSPELRSLPGIAFYEALLRCAAGVDGVKLSEEALAAVLPEEASLWRRYCP